jgi:hypothetical protein
MSPSSPNQPIEDLRALRHDVREADDGKIRQIVTLLDGSPENQVSQAVLNSVRPRLAALKPIRSLRFARLLSIPLDDLIVPAAVWRPGQTTIPRTVLKPMTSIVRLEMDTDTAIIDSMIAGHSIGDTEVITRAGQALWGRAAEILSRAHRHAEWEATGLKPAIAGPLVQAIVTVLRRATPLRSLMRDAELGVLEPDGQAVREIVFGMEAEPADGHAMVVKLILRQLPRSVSLLRRLVGQSPTQAEKVLLQTAIDRATRDILEAMDTRPDLAEGLRDGPLAAVGTEVQRIAHLLQDISHDPNAARHRARVTGIRAKLDTICRGRFADGMNAGLVAPLAAATAPVDSAGQLQLETCARDLRAVETAGRKLGNPATYDALLFKGGEAVQAAADSGTLGTMRAIRLVEILCGPAMAEAMHKKASASPVR